MTLLIIVAIILACFLLKKWLIKSHPFLIGYNLNGAVISPVIFAGALSVLLYAYLLVRQMPAWCANFTNIDTWLGVFSNTFLAPFVDYGRETGMIGDIETPACIVMAERVRDNADIVVLIASILGIGSVAGYFVSLKKLHRVWIYTCYVLIYATILAISITLGCMAMSVGYIVDFGAHTESDFFLWIILFLAALVVIPCLISFYIHFSDTYAMTIEAHPVAIVKQTSETIVPESMDKTDMLRAINNLKVGNVLSEDEYTNMKSLILKNQ